MKIRETFYRVKYKAKNGEWKNGSVLPYLMVKNAAHIANIMTFSNDYYIEKIDIPEDVNQDLIFTLEKP